jgi:hypothetical protein
MSQDFIATLDSVIDDEWREIYRAPFAQHVLRLGVDKDLYKLTMMQIYHYTRHNPINQAFATWRVEPERTGLLRFCFEHAAEELGHENMVLNDLRSVGLFEPADLETPPLPATEGFIGYLYYVGLHFGAIARLGYSYWAETVYTHIGELLGKVRADLSLGDNQMTFFVSHAEIDEKHAEDVRRAIQQHAKTDAERDLIVQVTRTTLRLTRHLLSDVHEAYHAVADAPACTASAA